MVEPEIGEHQIAGKRRVTMKAVVLLAVGVAAGFMVAHQVAKTAPGRQFFDDVGAKTRDFGEAIVDGYRSREAELRAAAEGTVSDFTARAR